VRYQQDQNDGPSKAERDRLARDAERMRDPVLRAHSWRAMARGDRRTVEDIARADRVSPLIVRRSIVTLIDYDLSDPAADTRAKNRLLLERDAVLGHGDESEAERRARFMEKIARTTTPRPNGPSLLSILQAAGSNAIAS
jgi:hypothetical protein